MSFNFPLILVLGTALCGLVWLVDSVFLSPGRLRRQAAAGRGGHNESNHHSPQEPWPVEYARSFFPVLLIVLILRSFIFEPFRIPSGSMIPTLLIGDFILVNKFSYGVRLPVINTKIIETGSPNRGDVAVFRYPRNPQQDYIKRVIGLPGDKIVYIEKDKTLQINGQSVEMTGENPFLDPKTKEPVRGLVQSTENLLGIEHNVLRTGTGNGSEGVRSWDVPAGHYFMMGDNRDNSSDSRVWGFVPEENLVGKAFFIWMNYNDMSVLWNRIGDSVK